MPKALLVSLIIGLLLIIPLGALGQSAPATSISSLQALVQELQTGWGKK